MAEEIHTALTQPLLWVIIAVGIIIWLILTPHPKEQPIAETLDKNTARPGDLVADGSTKTSKLEQKVRTDIENAGFKLYPGSTAIITHPDERGRTHKYTPDIICINPKVIIEVDPQYTHKDTYLHDHDRGLRYQELGYGVVRLRMGVGRLGKYDAVFEKTDYDRTTMLPVLLAKIRKARPERRRKRTKWRPDN